MNFMPIKTYKIIVFHWTVHRDYGNVVFDNGNMEFRNEDYIL